MFCHLAHRPGRRKRADEVFTHCIKPACEETKYQAIRADMMSGDRVTPEIEEAIRTSPMVIAYFGSPPWNPNVMYEFGRRIESGMPYVVLKDEKTAEGELTELPFDLKDERVADLSTPLDLNLEAIGPKIRTIRKLILDRSSNPCGFTTVYPSAVVELPIDREGLRKVKEASDVLEELFEMPNIGGRHLYEVIRHLETKMTPNQYAAFLEDQRRVTNDLLSGDPFYDLRQGGNACALASASVPIVFSDHNTLRGHAYLPVIVRHARVKSSDAWRLDVVYIEVTAACHWDDRGKFYRCRLVDNNVLDPNPEADSKRVALKALG